MGHVNPSMSMFGSLWIAVAYAAEKNQDQFSPFRSTKLEFPIELRPMMRDSEFVQHTQHLVPPHLFLLMFRHAAAPFVNKEHFRPVAGRRTFQSTLTNILVPLVIHSTSRWFLWTINSVEVWCGYRKVSIRINTAKIGVKGADSDFYLGTCPISRSMGSYLYFHYDLNDCGSSLKVRRCKRTIMNTDTRVIQLDIIYSNSVEFTPAGSEDEEEVIRVMPLTLPIQCLYNRFHYSYKMGYVPHGPWTFWRTLGAKHRFTLSVCNEWGNLQTAGPPRLLKACLVKFFQKDAEEQEEEVFQGEVEENLSPAEVDEEHAVQQVKFLQKYAEEKGEEDFNGGVEGSLSPAEVDDEN
ncbi:hypothetical protein SRHO_G00281250 [Serrasalmus rhombeus]